MSPKILMFGWEFPPFNSGGLGTACLGLTKALSSHANITFVLPKKLPVDSTHLKFVFADDRDIKIIEINSALTPYIDAQGFEKQLSSKSSIYGKTLMEEVYRYGLAAAQIARQKTFDIIHAHDWLTFQAGVKAKQACGKPLVVHVHSTEFDRTAGGINQDIYEIEKQGMEQADKIIAVSGLTKQIIVDRYGISPDKIAVVHNGIETAEYKSHLPNPDLLRKWKEQGVKVVLFVGRITVQKGPDYLMQAAKNVLAYDPKVIFVVAGSGDMENQIIRQAVELGISDKVFFTGFLRGQELKDIYKAADLFIMPSVSEPFGITALESLACGTPTIISKQSGVAETVTASLKVDFWDTDEMANKILGLLHYSALSRTLKDQGGKEVESVTWDKAAGKCLGIYQQLLV